MIDLATRQPLPPFTKMSVEPLMLDRLIALIRERKPLNVLELGSGVSTVAMAYALEENGQGRLEALEHDTEQANQTRAWVLEHDLYPLATVHNAPLRNQVVPWDGMAYPWYAINGLFHDRKFDFVFVDGPPGTTSHMARWPAYFLLKAHLAADAVLVVDDTKRSAEAVMVEHWLRNDEFLYKTDLNTGRGGALLERKDHANPERPGETRQGAKPDHPWRPGALSGV